MIFVLCKNTFFPKLLLTSNDYDILTTFETIPRVSQIQYGSNLQVHFPKKSTQCFVYTVISCLFTFVLQKKYLFPKEDAFTRFFLRVSKFNLNFLLISIEDGSLKKMHSSNPIYTCYRVIFFHLEVFNRHFEAETKLNVV